MEENELYDRIGETDLNPTYKDGQVYQHTDVNQMLGILKTAINENYYDIQRLLNGAKTVGNAKKLDGATLSRYIDEELQSDDNKVPSSQQAKAYMDALFAGYSAPVRGVDYWTETDQQQIVSDTASNVIEEITPDLEEALAAKANINDIPTKISDLQNDSDFLSENNLQMVNTTDIQNGSQLTDATGYSRLNIIYGDTLQNGTPSPDNPVDINVVTGDIDITVSNSDSTTSQDFEISLGALELCKLGDYQDYIYTDGEKWYLHKETASINLTGNEDMKMINSGMICITTPQGCIRSSNSEISSIYCNVLSANTRNSIAGGNTGICYGSDNDYYKDFALRIENISTVNDFKTWLLTNSMIVKYALATPSTMEITDSVLIDQLNNVYNIIFFENETNFVITADDLAPTLNITYAITNRDIYSKEETNDLLVKLDKKQKEVINKKIYYFDNIDKMKAYNLVEGDMVVTKGYYDSNDNGGCEFIVKSASLKTNVALNNGLVAELIKDNSIVKYIFPKNWNSISGDANLIIAYGKVILIDSHDASYKNNLYTMLEKYNINHIDYFISTHYHKDHVGNFVNLINDGYVDKNTNIYLPCYVSHLMTEGTSMYTYYNDISQALNNAGLTGTVPEEGETIELGFGFKITFYNCEPQIFENYTDYNECSTVCLVEHNSIKSLYTGDCGYLKRFIDEEIIEDKVHLYKIEHHGINNNSNAVYLLRFILPDYAVQPSGMLDETINNYSTSQTITFLKAIGTKIYSVHENPEEIEFISENEQIKSIKGNENYSSSGGKFTISLYCDSNTTNTKQNGTSQYPYKDLPQALEHVLQTQVGEYNIYLADGEYNTQHSTTAKNIGRIRNSKITMIGNTNSNTAVKIKNYLEIFNSNVLIKYVNFVGTGSDSIRPYNSYLRVENCSFTIDANSTAKVGIYSNDGCDVVASNCSFNGNTIGISAHNGDNVCVNNCSFENLTDFYLVMTDATLREANNTVINCANPTIKYYNTGCDIFPGFTRPRELFSGSQVSGEITLSDNITNYNCLIVTTGTLGGTGLKTGFLIAYTDGYFKKGSKYRFAAISDDVIITVDSTTPNKITIAHSNAGTDEIRTIYGVHMKYYR